MTKKRLPRKKKKRIKKAVNIIMKVLIARCELANLVKLRASGIERIEFETGGISEIKPNVITEWKPDPNKNYYKYIINPQDKTQ